MSTEPLQSVNPATGETIASYPQHSPDEITSLIEHADTAQSAWKDVSFDERAAVLRRAADLLEARRDELAELVTAEMGKPIEAGRGEVDKCAWGCRFYADNAERFLSNEPVDTGRAESFVHYEPIGVVLAIMPWNFPLWQVFRFAAPALMAGNAAVLKHASNVTGTSLAIAGLFADAGLPDGVFTSLICGSDQVEAIIEHPAIKAATLTGSGAAGRAVAAIAGRNLKKSVLELGGSDPYVVLDDADLAQAAKVCTDSRLTNSGQTCIAAKRLVVVDAVYDEFLDVLVDEMASRTVGDPTDEATDVGPQARTDLRDELHDQVQRSIEQGARLLLGGDIPDGPGAYYPPTVLADVTTDMVAATEELFGPVAAVMRAADLDDAVRIANDTVYGLGAAIFTGDVDLGRQVATERLNAGSVAINSMVVSDPRLPFGGVGESGYGRELSDDGIKEFVNIKTVTRS